MKRFVLMLLIIQSFLVCGMDLSQSHQNDTLLKNSERSARIINDQHEVVIASSSNEVYESKLLKEVKKPGSATSSLSDKMRKANQGEMRTKKSFSEISNYLEPTFIKKFGMLFGLNCLLTNTHLSVWGSCFNKTTCSVMKDLIASMYSCGIGNQLCGARRDVQKHAFFISRLKNCVSKISCVRFNSLTGSVSVLFQMALGAVIKSYFDSEFLEIQNSDLKVPLICFMFDTFCTIFGRFSTGIGNPLIFVQLLSIVSKIQNYKAATYKLESDQKLRELKKSFLSLKLGKKST